MAVWRKWFWFRILEAYYSSANIELTVYRYTHNAQEIKVNVQKNNRGSIYGGNCAL